MLTPEVYPLITPLTTIAIDLNAKRKLWNCPCLDRKELAIESLFLDNQLSIVNRKLNVWEFKLKGTSYLDIRLTSDEVLVPRWFFPSLLLRNYPNLLS